MPAGLVRDNRVTLVDIDKPQAERRAQACSQGLRLSTSAQASAARAVTVTRTREPEVARLAGGPCRRIIPQAYAGGNAAAYLYY
jgi:hypothetical protein